MQTDFFEEVDQTQVARPKNPIWAMDWKSPDSEADLLKWLNAEVGYLIQANKDRMEQISRNYALYKGIQYQTQEVRTQARDRSEEKSRAVQRIVINNLYDFTQHKVSRLIKYKPAVAILPSNDEFGDKVSAKMTKYLLDHIWYNENFEGGLTPRFVRNSKISGECYMFITWDPDKGDIHPDQKKMEGKKVPLLDENDEPIKNEKGKPIFIDKTVKVGDVKYEVVLTDDILLERKAGKKTFIDANYLFKREVMPVEEARLKYPKYAKNVKAQREFQWYDYEKMEIQNLEDHVVIWHFYHKYHPMMDKGAYIIFTKDGLLSKPKDLPYSHGELPCEPMTDIDLPGEMHGVSFFQMVKHMTGAHNNLTNMILRNFILVGHPKWMLPAGAAQIDQLGNDVTIVQYKGPTPPQLVSASTTGAEVFTFRDKLKEESQQIAGVFGPSVGQPPPGVKSGVALQFLDEKESERANEEVLKFNEWIRRVAKKTIAVAGDYYDPSDKRTIRVIGKNNQWMTVFFDASNLSKDYDIRIQNSSALPQSKAARIQTLFDLSDKYPDRVDPDQVLDLMDMAQSDKFVDIATVSVRAAEAENELLMQGKNVPEPKDYEHHIVHWKIHARQCQEFNFKNQTPPEIQQVMIDHIMATEMLMYDLAGKNTKFAEEIANLELFPMFFTPVNSPNGIMNDQTGQALSEGALQDIAPYVEKQEPIVGNEKQEPVNPPAPSMESQTQEGAPPAPAPGPVEPTGAV